MDAMISTQDSSHLSSFNSLTHDKIFSKIKRGRMGATDPRQILLEEAARFDEAEVNYQRKISDKNSILDETVSEWMVQGIKEEQMGKIMQGRRSTHSLTHTYSLTHSLIYSLTHSLTYLLTHQGRKQCLTTLVVSLITAKLVIFQWLMPTLIICSTT
jgi:hypothetical protein